LFESEPNGRRKGKTGLRVAGETPTKGPSCEAGKDKKKGEEERMLTRRRREKRGRD